MLNQRLLAAILAVTTVTTNVVVNVSASYAKNSTNFKFLAQRNQLKWVEVLDYVNKAIDDLKKVHDFDIPGKLQSLQQLAENTIRQEKGNE